MEHTLKPRQKLSLSSTYNKLHSALWEQKQKNYFLEKQNVILNTKISSIKENLNHKANPQREDYFEEKQKLSKMYAEVKNQEQWIKDITSMVEQKNFDKQYKRKIKIEKKLNKTNKKCKEMTKKFHRIQSKINASESQISNFTPFLGYCGDNQDQRQVQPNDVLAQLEKQNKELNSLLQFNQNQLNNETRKVKSLNNDIIDLLALKNWLRKYVAQSQKPQINEKQQNSSTDKRPISSGNPQSRLKIQQRGNVPSINNKTATTSMFKREPKLKIATY